VAVLALLVAGGLATAPAGAQAACLAPSGASAIAAENANPGTPQNQWDIQGAGSASIQGFATDISVNCGDTVHFKIDTTASSYRLDIYRMGWYGGDGARFIRTVNPTSVGGQPTCPTDQETGRTHCDGWTESASWTVPDTALSGIYFAHVVANTGADSHIVFVVRNDGSHSNLYLQTSDTTWQAYNRYGGNSLYTGTSDVAPDRAVKVSYDRPFTTRDYAP
jgi:hypothetical protein